MASAVVFLLTWLAALLYLLIELEQISKSLKRGMHEYF
jgi:hypothetical protein